MADLTLSDGKEITLNMNAFSISEWRGIFKPDAPENADFQIIAKACGIKLEVIQNMGFEDFQKVKVAVEEKVKTTNPN